MVVKQEDLLGLFDPEEGELLFCNRCWEKMGFSICCSGCIFTADKAEDDRLYFCDECLALILET